MTFYLILTQFWRMTMITTTLDSCWQCWLINSHVHVSPQLLGKIYFFTQTWWCCLKSLQWCSKIAISISLLPISAIELRCSIHLNCPHNCSVKSCCPTFHELLILLQTEHTHTAFRNNKWIILSRRCWQVKMPHKPSLLTSWPDHQVYISEQEKKISSCEVLLLICTAVLCLSLQCCLHHLMFLSSNISSLHQHSQSSRSFRSCLFWTRSVFSVSAMKTWKWKSFISSIESARTLMINNSWTSRSNWTISQISMITADSVIF